MYYLFTQGHNFKSFEIFSILNQQNYNNNKDYTLNGSTRVFYIRDGAYGSVSAREEIIKKSNIYSYNNENYRLIYSNENDDEQDKEINAILLRFWPTHILREIFR